MGTSCSLNAVHKILGAKLEGEGPFGRSGHG